MYSSVPFVLALCRRGARWRARAMLVIAVTAIAATPINDAVV
jgi:hypothetical protein